MIWKRKNIPTLAVLNAYSVVHDVRRIDHFLCQTFGAPYKIVWAAMEREYKRGFIDFGVNLRGGWLTVLGESHRDKLLADYYKTIEG